MDYQSQRFASAVHRHYIVGAWIFVSIRFSKRLVLLDERSNDFLKTLVLLGGYCTIEQAARLGLANSARRVVARLEALKQSGFLKEIAHYPVIYQVTGSATRLVGSDLMARRQRTPLTIRCKLLGLKLANSSSSTPRTTAVILLARRQFNRESGESACLDELDRIRRRASRSAPTDRRFLLPVLD
jgi:hypothetical protein